MKKNCDFFGCETDPLEVPEDEEIHPLFVADAIKTELLMEHKWIRDGNHIFCPDHRADQWGPNVRFKEYRGMAMFQFVEAIFFSDTMRPRPIGFKFDDQSTALILDYFIVWDDVSEEFFIDDMGVENDRVTTENMIAVQFFYNTTDRDARALLADIDEKGPSAAMINQFLSTKPGPDSAEQWDLGSRILEEATRPQKREPL